MMWLGNWEDTFLRNPGQAQLRNLPERGHVLPRPVAEGKWLSACHFLHCLKNPRGLAASDETCKRQQSVNQERGHASILHSFSSRFVRDRNIFERPADHAGKDFHLFADAQRLWPGHGVFFPFMSFAGQRPNRHRRNVAWMYRRQFSVAVIGKNFSLRANRFAPMECVRHEGTRPHNGQWTSHLPYRSFSLVMPFANVVPDLFIAA